MSKFVSVDAEEDDYRFHHVNPNSIVDMRIEETVDHEAPYDVICTTITGDDIVYSFTDYVMARNFIRRVGGVD